MSATPTAPQALQNPDDESIESPSVDRELKSGRILHQARAHCPLGRETGGTGETRWNKSPHIAPFSPVSHVTRYSRWRTFQES